MCDIETGAKLVEWPISGLRTYGQKDRRFTLVAGRRCPSGEGEFRCRPTRLRSSSRMLVFAQECMSKYMYTRAYVKQSNFQHYKKMYHIRSVLGLVFHSTALEQISHPRCARKHFIIAEKGEVTTCTELSSSALQLCKTSGGSGDRYFGTHSNRLTDVPTL